MTWFRFFYALLRPVQRFLWPTCIEGVENVPEGPCILCPNHSNFSDPFLMVFAFKNTEGLRFMSKKENMTLPFLGWFYRQCGAFSVDREGQDIQAFRTVRRILQEGKKLVIFPEGTRTAVDDIEAGHPGAVRFAARQNVPVVPVFITRNKVIFRKVRLVFGAPYYVTAKKQEEFVEETRALMGKIFALGEKNEH